ncbi:MAG: GntP family permease, partial [Planctomycetota bacterium]|nr:GntP family permease [Planctomycetota bacterium]
MSPVFILVISILIVVIAILVLRLHAFLALLFAALIAAFLTSDTALDTYAHDSGQAAFVKLHGKPPLKSEYRNLSEYKAAKLAYHDAQDKSIADYKTVFKKKSPMARVAFGFGETCGKIGILIAMASIIGKCMLDSGAADRIVRTVLHRLGEKRAGLAFMGSGFMLSIPVFFDTVFYLMIPLAKATRLRVGKNYLLFILAIVAGGSMAHSLVPPTPGPLIVAEEFNVNLMTMIVAGCCVGLCSSVAGLTFAGWINRRMEIPLRDSADASLEELNAQAKREQQELPPFWLSLLPIVLPVFLIACATATDTYYKNLDGASPAGWIQTLKPTIQTLGDKNIALIIATIIAMGTFICRPGIDRHKMSKAISGALASGGIIILITSAGGGFGAAIRQSGIKEVIAGSGSDSATIATLLLAFALTALIRTAQGSSTVAMITVASIFSPLALQPDLLPYHPVYLALAVGCGSKPIAWMADSGFWVICKMSGMTESEALRTITPMSI